MYCCIILDVRCGFKCTGSQIDWCTGNWNFWFKYDLPVISYSKLNTSLKFIIVCFGSWFTCICINYLMCCVHKFVDICHLESTHLTLATIMCYFVSVWYQSRSMICIHVEQSEFCYRCFYHTNIHDCFTCHKGRKFTECIICHVILL